MGTKLMIVDITFYLEDDDIPDDRADAMAEVFIEAIEEGLENLETIVRQCIEPMIHNANMDPNDLTIKVSS